MCLCVECGELEWDPPSPKQKQARIRLRCFNVWFSLHQAAAAEGIERGGEAGGGYQVKLMHSIGEVYIIYGGYIWCVMRLTRCLLMVAKLQG